MSIKKRAVNRSFMNVAMVTLSFGVGFSVSVARANGRIGPGARIPLAVSTPQDEERLSDVVSQCFYEETMKSLLPQAFDAELAEGSTRDFNSSMDKSDDRVGDDTSWTNTSHWSPRTSVEFSYLEPQTGLEPITRYVDLTVASAPSYYTVDTTSMSATIRTDAFGDVVDVDLSLEAALPYVEVTSKGSRSCSVNNWGRDGCTDNPASPPETELVIPLDFTAGDEWNNDYTGHKTRKRFDFFNYADCILWNWENPAP